MVTCAAMLIEPSRLICHAQFSRQLSAVLPPSAALEALLPLDACLLESRTAHPGARFSFIGCSPMLSLRLQAESLVISHPMKPDEVIFEQPLVRFFDCLEQIRNQQPSISDIPFTSGWVGYFTHELGCQLLDVPLAEANQPARPAGCLALFKLYPDVLVYDHQHNSVTLYGSDWGDGETAVQARLDQIEQQLTAAATTNAAASGQAQPPAVKACATTSLTTEQFIDGQESLQQLIREGDCFQANLTSSRAWAWRDGQPDMAQLVALYRRYTEANPGAWCGFFADHEATLLSASPELLVNWEQQALRMRPIAGTRSRGENRQADEALAKELQTDIKERAEHTMLVDLVRNDLAAISQAGTVDVLNFAGVERYRHVMHLVSEVGSQPRAGLDIATLMAAVFPGGTVTGAPKRRALVRIGERENGPRGAYTGALGYIDVAGAAQFNLLIRTLVATPSHLVAHAGCGIVVASESAAEVRELEAKAQAQVSAALGQGTVATAADRCGEVTPGPTWQPDVKQQLAGSAEVLIVDFEDSFVHNLADYCRRLGAIARVVSAANAPADGWELTTTHLILSPGPGRPADFSSWPGYVELARQKGIPILGVCLGHQALGEADGAKLSRHSETVHGHASRLVRLPAAATDPLLSQWQGQQVGRYHSLIIDQAGNNMQPLACLEDGTLMAVRYGDLPHWGVQFHPESLLTDDGLTFMAAFLACATQ